MNPDTVRLRLLPFAPADLLTLIEAPERFEEHFGFRAADGLRDFLAPDEVPAAWLALLRGSSAADPWVHGFAVVHDESRQVIGTAGFKGPPDADGAVEIAYATVPEFQGRGYATEAVAALLAFTAGDSRVRVVRAHTLPQPGASARVLQKCGFTHLGEVEDPEDGLVWRWERVGEPS